MKYLNITKYLPVFRLFKVKMLNDLAALLSVSINYFRGRGLMYIASGMT